MPESANQPHHVFVKVDGDGPYIKVGHTFQSYEAADAFCDKLVGAFESAGVEGFDVYEKATGEDE